MSLHMRAPDWYEVACPGGEGCVHRKVRPHWVEHPFLKHDDRGVAYGLFGPSDESELAAVNPRVVA